MKQCLFLLLAVCAALPLAAQTADDPVVMTIAGVAVPRSEFEYSYNKNNREGVVDKKSLDEYVDLFINYKLKVVAAHEAGIDTLSSFLQEYASYRDQQIRPAMITSEDLEREARRLYEESRAAVAAAGGIVKPAEIVLVVAADADDAAWQQCQQRADSLYRVLQEGNFSHDLFGALAEQYSQNNYTKKTKGEYPWLRRGMFFPEVDSVLFAMEEGTTVAPVRAADGYHILQLRGKQDFMPYDTLHAEILSYLDHRGVRDQLINAKLDSLAAAAGDGVSRDDILAQKREAMVADDEDLKYLLQEYHDGLMLYEISNQLVWEKAANDEKGLAKYYKKNKKRYTWDAPRYKGIAYRTRVPEDVDRVRAALSGVPFDEWVAVLRTTFNADSVQIRAEKGIFRKGDNAIIDKYVFGEDTLTISGHYAKEYPYAATYGTLLSQPTCLDDVRGLVVGDYQELREKEWVAALRRKYPFSVDAAVLATVNNH